MTIKITSASPRQFVASSGATSVQIHAPGNGELVVTSPGGHHVVVGHVPYYVDVAYDVKYDYSLVLRRAHVTYRYGADGTPAPAPTIAAVLELVDALVAVLVRDFSDVVGQQLPPANPVSPDYLDLLAARRDLRVMEPDQDRLRANAEKHQRVFDAYLSRRDLLRETIADLEGAIGAASS